jgi:hypothetical protein
VSEEDVDMTEAPALPPSQKTPAKTAKETAAEKKKRKLEAASDVTATPGADGKKSKKARVESQPTPKAKSSTPSIAAGKVTPIAPPVIPGMLPMSSQAAPTASTPSAKASKSKKVSASQPTPVPKPAEPSSSAPLNQATDEPKTNAKVKKEKKGKALKTEPGTEAPKKTTPVPLPHVPL